MSEAFEKNVNGLKYTFNQAFCGPELIYRISFDTHGRRETFEMKKNWEKIWCIEAEELPSYVYDAAPKLNDAIKSNIYKGVAIDKKEEHFKPMNKKELSFGFALSIANEIKQKGLSLIKPLLIVR